jgi:tRNA(His) 5'-end guanylyltransferase
VTLHDAIAVPVRSRAAGEEFKGAERVTRTILTPGLPAVIRLDGRAFHSYCKGLERPFDERFMADMDAVAVALAEQVDGVRLAYVQSDEISLLLTDHIGDAVHGFMFGGQVQKLVSITAAIASSVLNASRHDRVTDKIALFDSRAFSLPDMDAAQRYFEWRQADAQVNSLSMLASAHFPHKKLLGVGNAERVRMLADIGVDAAALPARFVNGRVVRRRPVPQRTTFFDGRSQQHRTVEFERKVAFVEAAPPFADGLDAAAF